ncbi:hypothetical protein PF004_g14682 [Phytophthora fragariae]|uniref:Uncharacterized protein n=1 Tax=Phytophthora fragariae TaxID=53985 RepID=A0A6G0NNL1_9STRA|nr:hypothetical protein PF004_g14682 [Phytophthora fragariae]
MLSWLDSATKSQAISLAALLFQTSMNTQDPEKRLNDRVADVLVSALIQRFPEVLDRYPMCPCVTRMVKCLLRSLYVKDHLVTNSGDADGKEANSDRVVTNSGCGDGEEANSDRVVANSGCGDGEEANSDRVVANSGGGDGEEANSDRDGANSDGGGAKSDSAGAKPDNEADKSDRGGVNTDGDGDKSDKGDHWRKTEHVQQEVVVLSCKRPESVAMMKTVSVVVMKASLVKCQSEGDASAASSGCASDSDDSLFEIDTHEKKTPACSKKQIFFRKRYPKNQVVLEWSGADKSIEFAWR